MMTDIVERLEATGGKGQGGPLKKEAADEIRKLRAIIASAQAVTGHPRHNVYFMCQCCEEENPENAVCCREDIAVMPDGTWLCDNCYSDCEKTAYGLVASDIEDFEFPQFEDFPRPAPYIDLALSSAQCKESSNG